MAYKLVNAPVQIAYGKRYHIVGGGSYCAPTPDEEYNCVGLDVGTGKFLLKHKAPVKQIITRIFDEEGQQNYDVIDYNSNIYEFEYKQSSAYLHFNLSKDANPADFLLYKWDPEGLADDIKEEIADSLWVVNNRLTALEKLHENDKETQIPIAMNERYNIAKKYLPFLDWEMYQEKFTAYNVALPVTDMHKYLTQKQGSYAFAEKIRVTGFVPNFRNRKHDIQGAFAIRFKMTDDNWFGENVKETPRILLLPENSIVDRTIENIPFDTVQFGFLKQNGQFIDTKDIDLEEFTNGKKEQLKLDFEFVGYLNWD